MTAKKVVEPEVELDPATGFPVVPDGYFWRVGEQQWQIVVRTGHTLSCQRS